MNRAQACFDSKSADFIYQTTLPLLDQLAQHPYGLCVVKKCIAQANEQSKQQATQHRPP